MLGLGGVALVTSWLWIFLLVSYFIAFPFYFLFPFSQRLVSMVQQPPYMLYAACYGVGELIIAWGLYNRKRWSRIALMGLAVVWIVYAVWDNITIYPGTGGSADYYLVDPFVVAYGVAAVILMWYMLRKKVRTHFSKS